MHLVVGILLAAATATLARFTRFEEERSFYSTVMVIIASYYVLFAVLGGSSHALAWELVVALLFSTVGILGAFFLPVLVGIAIMGHGLFDLVHDLLIENSGVPPWWPAFCGIFDIVLGLWVIGLYRSRPPFMMKRNSE